MKHKYLLIFIIGVILIIAGLWLSSKEVVYEGLIDTSTIVAVGLSSNNVYYADQGLTGSPNWTTVSGTFKQVSGSFGRLVALNGVGAVSYGTRFSVSESPYIWTDRNGQMSQVSFDYPFLLALDTNGLIKYVDDITSSAIVTWKPNTGRQATKAFKSISMEAGAAFAIGTDNLVWYTDNVRAGNWTNVTGSITGKTLTQIVFDTDLVIVIDSDNKLYSASNPYSLATKDLSIPLTWRSITGTPIKQISLKNNMAMGIGADNNIYFCGTASTGGWSLVNKPSQDITFVEIMYPDRKDMIQQRPGRLEACNPGYSLSNGQCLMQCTNTTITNQLKPCVSGSGKVCAREMLEAPWECNGIPVTRPTRVATIPPPLTYTCPTTHNMVIDPTATCNHIRTDAVSPVKPKKEVFTLNDYTVYTSSDYGGIQGVMPTDSGGKYSLDKAKALCNALPYCYGFTYAGNGDVTFKVFDGVKARNNSSTNTTSRFYEKNTTDTFLQQQREAIIKLNITKFNRYKVYNNATYTGGELSGYGALLSDSTSLNSIFGGTTKITQAQGKCDEIPQCYGFTYDGTNDNNGIVSYKIYDRTKSITNIVSTGASGTGGTGTGSARGTGGSGSGSGSGITVPRFFEKMSYIPIIDNKDSAKARAVAKCASLGAVLATASQLQAAVTAGSTISSNNNTVVDTAWLDESVIKSTENVICYGVKPPEEQSLNIAPFAVLTANDFTEINNATYADYGSFTFPRSGQSFRLDEAKEYCRGIPYCYGFTFTATGIANFKAVNPNNPAPPPAGPTVAGADMFYLKNPPVKQWNQEKICPEQFNVKMLAKCNVKCPTGYWENGLNCVGSITTKNQSCPVGTSDIGNDKCQTSPIGTVVTQQSATPVIVNVPACSANEELINETTCATMCEPDLDKTSTTCAQPTIQRTGYLATAVCSSNEDTINGICLTKCPTGSFRSGEICVGTQQVIAAPASIACKKTPLVRREVVTGEFQGASKWLCDKQEDANTLLKGSGSATYVKSYDEVCISDDPDTAMYYCEKVSDIQAKNGTLNMARADHKTTCSKLTKNFFDISNNMASILLMQAGMSNGSTQLSTVKTTLNSIYTQLNCTSNQPSTATVCSELNTGANYIGDRSTNISSVLSSMTTIFQSAGEYRDSLRASMIKFQCPP
jgi:hypothetical protein